MEHGQAQWSTHVSVNVVHIRLRAHVCSDMLPTLFGRLSHWTCQAAVPVAAMRHLLQAARPSCRASLVTHPG
jgi:hypothetical protein